MVGCTRAHTLIRINTDGLFSAFNLKLILSKLKYSEQKLLSDANGAT